jgi:predicted RNase H-like nuclease (RuvC/YqgF family)
MSKPGESLFPKGYQESLKSLESLVLKARNTIQRLKEENGNLQDQIRDLKSEKRDLMARTKQLQENTKQAMMTRGRSSLAKAKIKEIIRRIEKVESEGGSAQSKTRRRV